MLLPDLQASTILEHNVGPRTYCSLCSGVDNSISLGHSRAPLLFRPAATFQTLGLGHPGHLIVVAPCGILGHAFIRGCVPTCIVMFAQSVVSPTVPRTALMLWPIGSIDATLGQLHQLRRHLQSNDAEADYRM